MNFNIHNLLKIRVDGTNSRYLKYLSGDYSYFKTEEPADPDIDLFLTDFTPDTADCYVIDRKYWIKPDYLFCTHRHKVVNWKVSLAGLTQKKTTVYFSGSRYGELLLRDYVLEPLISLKLAAKGFVLLHASGIALNGNGFIFPACQGVGKTSTLLNLVGKGPLLGNDKVILSREGKVYSYPSFVHIFSYNLRDVPHILNSLTWKQRVEIRMNYLIKLLTGGYASFPLDVNPRDLWGEAGGSYPLKSLLLLTKTNRDFTRVTPFQDTNLLIKRLSVINQFEMEYFDRLMSAYLYVYPDSSVGQYWPAFSDNLGQALGSAACYDVEIPRRYNAETFTTILKLLEEQASVKVK